MIMKGMRNLEKRKGENWRVLKMMKLLILGKMVSNLENLRIKISFW